MAAGNHKGIVKNKGNCQGNLQKKNRIQIVHIEIAESNPGIAAWVSKRVAEKT